jgi:DNA-binding MarR family transcriptional regulator
LDELSGGDIKNGETIMMENCAACHQYKAVKNAPNYMAPELSNIGGYSNASYLLESIVDPSAAVDTLEKKGYLIRYTDPDDKRIVHLKLTEQTDDIVRAIEEKQEALVSCIFAGFSEDEKKNFAAYNTRLYQNVMSHLK